MLYRKISIILVIMAMVWPPQQYALSANNEGQTPYFSQAEANLPPVIINELMWMGSSLSSYDEWLELKNLTDQAVDLSGWRLTRKSSGEEKLMLTIPDGSAIAAQGYFLIANYGSDSTSSQLAVEPDLVDPAVSLANSALQIKLYDADNDLMDIADDGSGKPLAGDYVSSTSWASMERNIKIIGDGTLAGSWHTAGVSRGFDTDVELGTPGTENSNSLPIVEVEGEAEAITGEPIGFSAAEATDPDGDELAFSWDFGDGGKSSERAPSHVYKKAGEYLAVLRVSDGSEEIVKEIKVTVTDKTVPFLPSDKIDWSWEEANESIEEGPATEPIDTKASTPVGAVYFTEIFPNPAGADKAAEYIEIYNAEKEPLEVTGWQIVLGTKKFTFPEAKIAGQSYIALGNETTKLTLTNAGGQLSLLGPQEELLDSVEYGAGEENSTWARIDDQWQWTEKPTPGKKNELEIKQPEVLSSDEIVLATSESSTEDNKSTLSIESLAEVDSLEKNDKVIVTGVVTVEPGTFGAQYFYIFDGSKGIKIYSSKKAFPNLSIGDQVEVTGKVGESEGEKKVNVSNEEDIKVLASDAEISPLDVSIGEITEEMIGSLVVVEGTASEIKSSSFTVTADDEELLISIKRNTKIGKPEIEEEGEVSVTGIVSLKSGELTIYPRSIDDIVVAGAVLGEMTEELTELSGDNQAGSVKTILIVCFSVLAVAGAAVGYWWWWRKRLSNLDTKISRN
ncbi:MAG: lamin tail domain-containing protein [Patescibacteria group bacterium]